jgi:hypothetical protein
MTGQSETCDSKLWDEVASCEPHIGCCALCLAAATPSVSTCWMSIASRWSPDPLSVHPNVSASHTPAVTSWCWLE